MDPAVSHGSSPIRGRGPSQGCARVRRTGPPSMQHADFPPNGDYPWISSIRHTRCRRCSMCRLNDPRPLDSAVGNDASDPAFANVMSRYQGNDNDSLAPGASGAPAEANGGAYVDAVATTNAVDASRPTRFPAAVSPGRPYDTSMSRGR
jgi:hypothetical protein